MLARTARSLAANYRAHRADQHARERAIEAASDAIGNWNTTALLDGTLPAAPVEASAIERLLEARSDPMWRAFGGAGVGMLVDVHLV